MREKILFVDDEPAVLQGHQRLLRREFDIDTAIGGAEALAAIHQHGPYAIVVSDMRMPEMTGVELLIQIKAIAPDTVRVVLTGQADIEAALDAVNEGNIFRFLTKPCSKELLAKTVNAGLMQYRLITAEKVLLEKTLRGSIRVLAEVLSLVNPAAFGRAMRVRRYIHHVVTRMELGSPWRFEIAALMSQLGCVTLHPDTIESVYAGQPLSPAEKVRFNTHPKVAAGLLSSIPRMEPIAWMIAHQMEPATADQTFADSSFADRDTAGAVQLGSSILRASLLFDELLTLGKDAVRATNEIELRFPGLDPRICQALKEVEPEASSLPRQVCPVADLAPGMILRQEIRSSKGQLLATKGQDVTFPLILKLKIAYEKGSIPGTVAISVPPESEQLQ